MAAVVLIFPVLFSLCGAAIHPVEKSYSASVGDNVQLTWNYDDENQMFSVDWTFQSENANTPESIMTQSSGNPASAENNYDVEHGGNGIITLKSVTMDSSGKYFCAVSYNLGSGLSPVTGTATIAVNTPTTDCCFCLKKCEELDKVLCILVCVIIICFASLVVCIIAGMVVEAICHIWGGMNQKWRIASFFALLFGLGVFLCDLIRQSCGEPGKGDKASNVVNTGSHPDKKKKGRPQPPPPSGANSNHRQLPDIHDKKGRGLPANYNDDDHPLVSINIPTKKAGALESIPDSAREEVTKKKKKRKKRVETEDDQSDY